MRPLPIDLSSRLQRTSEQVHTLLDGNVVIMTLADGKYFELNPVGARIWDELEQPIAIPEVVDRLLADYEIDEETCRSEVETWLTKMSELGLVIAAE